MTYYLKYRPQKIAELDLKSVREQLTEILKGKNIPHAFLFVGPKGTGKTSSARILAKAINCLKKTGFEPCNQCENCRMINNNQSLDILEIDAASNRGIDDIRELREKIKLAPFKLNYKVYIIDEVHMLTLEAFNALLKTLEEPPKHVKFVLCTTEAQKLPATIVSRCFKIKFSKATKEELKRSLQRVVKNEGLKISDQGLEKISFSSDGSFRDAVKILESLALTGKEITEEKISRVLETGFDGSQLDQWLVWVYEGQAAKAIKRLNEAIGQGMNCQDFLLRAVERLRMLLLKKLEAVEEVEEIEAISDREKLKKLLERLMEAGKQMKGAVIDSLPIELAVAEWKSGQSEETPQIRKPVKPAPGKSSKLEEVKEKWPEILSAMKPYNHSLEALLRSTKPAEYDGKNLTLEVFYKFHKERLETDRYRVLVEEVAGKILSQPIKIRYFLGKKKDENIIKAAEAVFGRG